MTDCPLCHAPVVRKFPFHNPFHEEIWECRCSSCGAEHLMPQPSDALLAEQYKNYFKRRDSRLHLIKEGYFRYLLDLVKVDLKGKRIADIGSGEGYLLSAIGQMGVGADLTGVEQGWKQGGPEWLQCNKLGLTIEEWLALDEKPYDVILGCDILEHVREPHTVIQGISQRKLSPGGILVITTPNTDSLSARCLGQLWPQYKLEHITLFGRASMEKMAADAGLQTLRLESLAKRLPLGYLLQVSSNFGPDLVQKVSRFFEPWIPDSLLRVNFTLMLGEWLWVAKKG